MTRKRSRCRLTAVCTESVRLNCISELNRVLVAIRFLVPYQCLSASQRQIADHRLPFLSLHKQRRMSGNFHRILSANVINSEYFLSEKYRRGWLHSEASNALASRARLCISRNIDSVRTRFFFHENAVSTFSIASRRPQLQLIAATEVAVQRNSTSSLTFLEKLLEFTDRVYKRHLSFLHARQQCLCSPYRP